MEEEILKRIYDFSKEKKIVDKAFIEKIVELYTSNYGLEDYIKETKILPCNRRNMYNRGRYNYLNKYILIYYEQTIKLITGFDKYLLSVIPFDQQLFYINLEITQTVLHELEHAFQYKQMNTLNNDEAEILRLSCINDNASFVIERLKKQGLQEDEIKEKMKEKKKKYFEFYGYAPEERLAQINSYRKLLDIILPDKRNYRESFNTEVVNLHSAELEGYELDNGINSPTIYYLQQQGENSSLEQFDWYDSDPNVALEKTISKYDLNERIKLGLPISSEEHKLKEKRRFYSLY